MAYNFTDVNGHLSHGPTIHGMKVLREAVEADAKMYPALAQFVEHGVSKMPSQLKLEASRFMSKTKDPNLKSTLQNLILSSGRAEEFFALTSHGDQ